LRRHCEWLSVNRRFLLITSTAVVSGIGGNCLTTFLMQDALPTHGAVHLAERFLASLAATIAGTVLGLGAAVAAVRCYDRKGPRMPRHPETLDRELQQRLRRMPKAVVDIVAGYVYDNDNETDCHDIDLYLRVRIDDKESRWLFRAEVDPYRSSLTALVDRSLLAHGEEALTAFGRQMKSAGVGIHFTPRPDVMALSFDLTTISQAMMTGRQLRGL
jgi:hypothetical protein